ncbi:MAG TPA: hypothetical protein PL045_05320, partial [Chitinophagaceae bacterium]|nr:hypothetical protein [Chitinophagaceae bacterium]
DWWGFAATCTIDIPELPAGTGLRIHYHAPFASLNSIYDYNVSNNAGYSVNNFKLEAVDSVANYGVKQVNLVFELAARDSDAFIHRVGFNITMTGELRPLPPVKPCKEEKDKVKELEEAQERLNNQIEILSGQIETENDPWRKAQLIQALSQAKHALEQCQQNLIEARQALTFCELVHTGVFTNTGVTK